MKTSTATTRRDVWNPRVEVEDNHYNWNGDPIIAPHNLRGSDNLLVDLFCGAGGFSVGLARAGFRPLLGVDIHRPSIDTYRQNHPGVATILGDIRKVSDRVIRNLIADRPVALVTAGVPCQGFSLCNRKRWEQDNRNFLFREFARIVKLLRPDYVLLENVSGLLSTSGGAFVHAICSAIEELDYSVESQTLNSADYGVPQKRTRVFFMGARKSLPITWPAPTHGYGQLPYQTVRDAISDLPLLENGEEKEKYDAAPKTEYQKLMRGDCKELLNHEAPNHPRETVQKIARTRPGEPMYPRFKQRIRLDWGQPSPTQVSGGIRPQFSLGHPGQSRGLSIRERCRIQSFPDSYFICGGIVQGRVQTGNAVPPLLAEAIGEMIIAGLHAQTPRRRVLPKKPAQLGLAL